MEAIHYKKIFEISDNCIVYVNGKNKLVVELVNDKYICIEMESNENDNKNIDELKKDLIGYNLSIDDTNFFVKKAEIELEEALKNKEGK